jgi:hypothetical protein
MDAGAVIATATKASSTMFSITPALLYDWVPSAGKAKPGGPGRCATRHTKCGVSVSGRALWRRYSIPVACRGNEVRRCNRATLNHQTIARWDECVREMLSDSSVAFVTIVRTFYGFVVELTRRLLSALAP